MTDPTPSPAPDSSAPAPLPAVAVGRVDQVMEEASEALVHRKYFLAERLCADALRSSIAAEDFERAARICLPLQEARRLKRQRAIDADRIVALVESLQDPAQLKPGCYLICPPRVGAEARALRQLADEAEVPIVVIAREPSTRAGLCPVVAVGPVTVRAFVPEPPQPPARPASKPRKPVKGEAAAPPAPASAFVPPPPPPLDWLLSACEALGDAAIAQAISPVAADRAVELHARLQSFPDHEKLHQRLMEACEAAAKEPRRRKPTPTIPIELDEFGEGSLSSED